MTLAIASKIKCKNINWRATSRRVTQSWTAQYNSTNIRFWRVASSRVARLNAHLCISNNDIFLKWHNPRNIEKTNFHRDFDIHFGFFTIWTYRSYIFSSFKDWVSMCPDYKMAKLYGNISLKNKGFMVLQNRIFFSSQSKNIYRVIFVFIQSSPMILHESGR